jgi:hypothetical protein
LDLSKGIGLIRIAAVYQLLIFSVYAALALVHPMESEHLNGALLLIDKANTTSLCIRLCPAIPVNQSL